MSLVNVIIIVIANGIVNVIVNVIEYVTANVRANDVAYIRGCCAVRECY